MKVPHMAHVALVDGEHFRPMRNTGPIFEPKLELVAEPKISAVAHGEATSDDRGGLSTAGTHADLPDIVSLDAVTADAGEPVAVIAPCHRDDGTPVLSIPVLAVPDHPPFEFSYGPGSFARHGSAARRAGLEVRVVRDHALAFDVDGPDDLALVLARRRVTPER